MSIAYLSAHHFKVELQRRIPNAADISLQDKVFSEKFLIEGVIVYYIVISYADIFLKALT